MRDRCVQFGGEIAPHHDDAPLRRKFAECLLDQRARIGRKPTSKKPITAEAERGIDVAEQLLQFSMGSRRCHVLVMATRKVRS
jgi:hypothetical protein